jgi:hypothetical protein
MLVGYELIVLFKAFICLVVIFWSPWISLLCAGEELLPLAGDADEGCQWEVQTDGGWTPYWDPQAQSANGWHSLLGQSECSDC